MSPKNPEGLPHQQKNDCGLHHNALLREEGPFRILTTYNFPLENTTQEASQSTLPSIIEILGEASLVSITTIAEQHTI